MAAPTVLGSSGQSPSASVPVHAASAETDASSELGNQLPNIGLAGTSPHSNFRRLRFAFGAFGPFMAALVMLNSKEIYVLKLGADADRLGAVFIAFAFLLPIFYLVAGRLMDREPPLLNWPGWGRRAPWFLLHLIVLTVATGLVLLPPGALLEVWLGIILLVSAWCLAVVLNSIEAAYAEIYPFKEERVLVQGMFKFVGVGSAIAGIAPQILLFTVATRGVRIAVSIFWVICLLLSLEAVPVLTDAQQPRSSQRHEISLRECLQVLGNPAMFHASFLRFWQGAADATALTFSVYYLTFVCELDGEGLSKWLFIGGSIVAPMDVALTFLWSFLWGSKELHVCKPLSKLKQIAPSLHSSCLRLHLTAALVCPLLLWLLPKTGVRPWEYVAWQVALRFCYSPQTFFRNSTFCWVVDEDCHAGQGHRREAVHAGVAKCLEELGRALGSCLFVGLGLAGLETENCEESCDPKENERSCVQACEMRVIDRQPQAVVDYILAMLYGALPLFGLLCALHIWLFPIHGARLEELQQKQAVNFKDIRKTPSLQT